MVELNEAVVAEVERREQNLLVEEFVELVERHHPHTQPGVTRETITQYAGALPDGATDHFGDGTLTETVDSRLTDSETWRGEDTLYALDDDRVSVYPNAWHRALGGSDDVREYVRYLRDEAGDFEMFDSQGAGRGIPEDTLLDVVTVVGRTDRDAVKAQVEERRDRGELVEGPDQHPEARVRLAEDAEDVQDPTLDK